MTAFLQAAVLLSLSMSYVVCTATHQPRPQAADKPHILFMLVDDWGWANVGYHRDPPTREVDTPNMDSLVKEGLELDQHYVYRYCSPSRSALISGRLPIHVNDKNLKIGNYNPNDPVSGYAGSYTSKHDWNSNQAEGGWLCHTHGREVACRGSHTRPPTNWKRVQ